MLRSLAAVLSFLLLAVSASGQDVDHGRYLTVLGDCAGCHDNPAGGHLTGGQGFTAAFGTVYSSNITPDVQTGIGAWSADDFWHALHDGIRKDGAPLYPAFPYPYFARFSRDDSDAIFAYLRAQKPIHNVPPANAMAFPINIRSSVWFWDMLYRGEAKAGTDPHRSAQWNRGEFIVNGPGHCAACHTPKNAMFGDRNEIALTGETITIGSPPILPRPRDGLGNWTVSDIETYLKTGQDRFATAVGPMQDVVLQSTSLMSDADRGAVAIYLKSLSANHHKVSIPPDGGFFRDGQAVYVQHCTICHEGAPGAPSLRANTLVQARDPTTVLRVILEGSQSIAIRGAKVSYSMPSLAALSDNEIAAVATFIRNAWGNRGGPVQAADVAKLRKVTDQH